MPKHWDQRKQPLKPQSSGKQHNADTGNDIVRKWKRGGHLTAGEITYLQNMGLIPKR